MPITSFMKKIISVFAFLLPLYLFAQNEAASNFSGRVVNESNKGVPYASITVKAGAGVVVADSAGYFSFPVNQKFPFKIVVSSTGYAVQEITVRNNNVSNVVITLHSLFQTDTLVITS